MISGVVAELSNAHNGSLERAHRIIEACAKAGADWMKFQAYTPAELVKLRGNGPAPEPWGSEGWTMYDLYNKAQTPHSWFPSLIRKCGEVGLPWFSSVFGTDSLEMLEKLGCPVYKMASLDIGADSLRHEIRKTGKPTIQSSPSSTSAADATLWCPPGYPQGKIANAQMMRALTIFDGLSYHGTDWKVPANAFKWGAKIVEVHVQLDDEPSELEADVSLTMTDLGKLVRASV